MSYLGFKHSKETKKKMSLASCSKNGYFYGKKHSKESNEKNRIAHLGKKHSEETKEKLKEISTGRKHKEETKEKIRQINLGKSISVETRKKMSKAKEGYIPWNKGKKFPEYSGKNHPNWKGGVTPIRNKIRSSVEYKEWSRSVLKKNDYTCQKTKKRGGKLVAHHIKNFAQYPELRFDIDNGITLSMEKHTEFHNKYGKIDNTLEQLNEFLCYN